MLDESLKFEKKAVRQMDRQGQAQTDRQRGIL